MAQFFTYSHSEISRNIENRTSNKQIINSDLALDSVQIWWVI